MQFQLLIIIVIFLRKLALNILNVDEEHLDYYEWERFENSILECSLFQMLSHIFFDDCMERASGEKGEMIVNQFVRHLISAIDQFGRKW